MIRLHRPTADEIQSRIANVDPAFGYGEVRATADPAAIGALASRYVIDRRRFSLGAGRPLFELARTALFTWRHFEIPWLELHGARGPVHEGQVVATLTRVLGLWFLNPCRVVYREDVADGTDAAVDEAAFAYGTLVDHVACGEERFTVRRDPASDEVVFEILAFSRPALLLTRLGHPWMRRVQKRFAADAAAALARACGGGAKARGAER